MQIKLPTTSIYGNSGRLSGSSVGNRLLPNMSNICSSVSNGVDSPLAAHENFSIQISLPATVIHVYENSGQRSGQPTTSKYDEVDSSVDSGVCCPWEFCHVNKAAHYFHIRIQSAAQWEVLYFRVWK